ncbi:MAG TPA: efflux RND transporter periplasmic adaptor subunit [Candidatus Binatia bacterium]|nr:efflux RND transporter periplasmic adaptor subunit [Candidatus Binatia bacterium]
MNKKLLFPILTLLGTAVLAVLMVVARPQAEPEIHTPPAPLVRVVKVVAADERLVVRAQGRVAPRTEIDLVAEVSGKIVDIPPSLASGGFFSQGDVLARIDANDYELAVERAKAEVAQAEVKVAMEEAEAEVAVREWKSLRGGNAPALVARRPQLGEARARLAAARAMHEQARTDLARTVLRAPFDGRVRSEQADVGQFVARGTPLARLYSTDAAEIRVPLPDEDLAFLELDLGFRGEAAAPAAPEAIVRARFAGREHQWSGRVVRTEGQIDPATHVIHAIIEVRDPYGRTDSQRPPLAAGTGERPPLAAGTGERPPLAAGTGERPPLAAGMFVDVDVLGRKVAGVIAVPRAAMRGPDRVLVVDESDRLHFRSVRVLRRESDRVLIAEGLRSGERVCVSPLEVAVEAMQVRVEEGRAKAAVETPSIGVTDTGEGHRT